MLEFPFFNGILHLKCVEYEKTPPGIHNGKPGGVNILCDLKLKKTLVVLSDKFQDLVCRGQGVSDRNVVVQGVDDGSDVLAHISFHIPFLCEEFRGTVV